MGSDTMDEIERSVWQRFPKLETERRCATEKRMRDAARKAYRQRLTDELQTTAGILEAMDEATDGN
jgi:hypothetical protein